MLNVKYTPLSVYVRDTFRISTWSLSRGALFSSVQLMAFAVLLLAVIKQCCIAAGAPFWIEGELPVFVVRPHAPNRDGSVRIPVSCHPLYIYIYIYMYVCVCVLFI